MAAYLANCEWGLVMVVQAPPAVIARAIIIVDDEIALHKRHINGFRYYSFPGGHIKRGETPEAAVVREVREETSLDVQCGELKYIYSSEKWGIQYFYACTSSFKQMLSLNKASSEYRDTQKGDNTYEPMWVPMIDLPKLHLLPSIVAKQIMIDDGRTSENSKPLLLSEVSQKVLEV